MASESEVKDKRVTYIFASNQAQAERLYVQKVQHDSAEIFSTEEVERQVGIWRTKRNLINSLVSQALRQTLDPYVHENSESVKQESFVPCKAGPQWFNEEAFLWEMERLNSPHIWHGLMKDSINASPGNVPQLAWFDRNNTLDNYAKVVTGANARLFMRTTQYLGLAAALGDTVTKKMKDDPRNTYTKGFQTMTQQIGEMFGGPARDPDSLFARLQKLFSDTNSPFSAFQILKSHHRFRQDIPKDHTEIHYYFIGVQSTGPSVRDVFLSNSELLRELLRPKFEVRRLWYPPRLAGVQGCPAVELTGAIYAAYGEQLKTPEYRELLRRRVSNDVY